MVAWTNYHEGICARTTWAVGILKVSQGYLNNPEATANSITPDGWFKTGDIAVIDEEGYYSIVDRRKELIKYKVRPIRLRSFIRKTKSRLGLPRYALLRSFST